MSVPVFPAPGDQQSLVDRVRQGDAAAEVELLETFHDRAVVMLTARTRDRDAARELAQETMIAVLAAVRDGRLREPEKLGGFVHGVARNLANNYIRLRTRDEQRRLELPDDLEAAPLPDTVDMRERGALARKALSHLQPLDRRILALSLVAGWEPRAIARTVGISAGLVRTRKSRALAKVREIVRQLTRSAPQVPRSL